jgi:6-phosphofructokinase 1
VFNDERSAMEAVGVSPAPVVAPEKKKLLDLKDPLAAPAATASPAPTSKWAMKKKLVGGDGAYVLEDVPHLTDYLPQLPVRARASMVIGVSVSRRGLLVS